VKILIFCALIFIAVQLNIIARTLTAEAIRHGITQTEFDNAIKFKFTK
jgi:hypothetical protein